MSADEAIRALLEPLLPAPTWAPMQYGQWQDVAGRRVSVLRPAGGPPAELLRRPAFTLTLVGLPGGDSSELKAAADAVIERARASAGGLVYVEASEPVFIPTADRRPMFEIALAAITT